MSLEATRMVGPAARAVVPVVPVVPIISVRVSGTAEVPDATPDAFGWLVLGTMGTAGTHTDASDVPRLSWGPGGRRFKSCLPDFSEAPLHRGSRRIAGAFRNNRQPAWYQPSTQTNVAGTVPAGDSQLEPGAPANQLQRTGGHHGLGCAPRRRGLRGAGAHPPHPALTPRCHYRNVARQAAAENVHRPPDLLHIGLVERQAGLDVKPESSRGGQSAEPSSPRSAGKPTFAWKMLYGRGGTNSSAHTVAQAAFSRAASAASLPGRPAGSAWPRRATSRRRAR